MEPEFTPVAEPASASATPATKAILFAGLLVFAMGQTIPFALMGPVARDIGLAEWQVGAIVSASAAVFVVASPMWGRLADRWGRKAVIVTGLAGYGLWTLSFAGALHAGLSGWIGAGLAFAGLLAARLLYAITSGGIQPAAVALMADVTSAKDRSAGLALVGAGFGLGTVLGPALAAGLVGLGVLVPLFVAAGLAMLIALVALTSLREPRRRSAGDGPPASIDLRALAPALALGFAVFVAISALQQTAAFYVQDFTNADTARAAQLSGFAFMALALAMLVVQGGVVQIFKPRPTLMLGLGLPFLAIGVIAYALAPDIVWLIAAFAVMGAGFGLVQPGISALVSLRTGADAQGGAAGYVQAAMAGGFVVGPLAGTLLYALSPRASMALALISISAGLILLLVILRDLRTSPPVLAPAAAE